VRALGSLSALVAVALNAAVPASGLGVAACHAGRGHAGADAERSPPKDEVWLTDDDVGRLRVTTEEVKLEEVDETIVAVGPVVSADECPVASLAETRSACVLVAIEQASLAHVRLDGAATARASDLVHDVFPGRVRWIAGALDSSGRTVRVACVFADPLAELRPGKQVRIELVVGERPAFAVSRGAVIQTREGTYVFAAGGTAEDGRHRFARVPVRTEGDTGGPWLPVANIKPGSVVVRSGVQTLASMLTVTAL
jgi:hypothetical protein